MNRRFGLFERDFSAMFTRKKKAILSGLKTFMRPRVVIITNDARWEASECVETHYPSNSMVFFLRLGMVQCIWNPIYITQYNVI